MGNNVGQLQQMKQEQEHALTQLDNKIQSEQASGNYNVALLCVALLVIAGMSDQVMKVMGVSDFTDVANQVGTNVYQVVSCLQYLEQNSTSITAGGTTSEKFWSSPTTEQYITNMVNAVGNLFFQDNNLGVSFEQCGVNIGGETWYIYTSPTTNPNTTDGALTVTLSQTPPSDDTNGDPAVASDLDILLSMSLASIVHKDGITSVSNPTQLANEASNGPIVKTLLNLGEAVNGLGGQMTYEGISGSTQTTDMLTLLFSMFGMFNLGATFSDNIALQSMYSTLQGQPTTDSSGTVTPTSTGGNLISDATTYQNNLDPSSSTYGQTSPFTAVVTAGQNAQKGISSTTNQEITIAKTAAQLIETLDSAGQAMAKSNQQLLQVMIRNYNN